jgi:asparagine synthetase A
MRSLAVARIAQLFPIQKTQLTVASTAALRKDDMTVDELKSRIEDRLYRAGAMGNRERLAREIKEDIDAFFKAFREDLFAVLTKDQI